MSDIPEALGMNIGIPRYTLGVDIETKGVTASAYILSIGCILYDNYTLKVQRVLNLTLNPNDPEQANRTEDGHTIKWWNTRGESPRYPSQAAYDYTWKGTLGFLKSMEIYHDFIRQLPRDGDTVLPMRGPDFDYVILSHALEDAGFDRNPMRARLLDSHRTVERVIHALELPPITEAEAQYWWKGPTPLPHVAVYDAALEGYETARMYHALHCIKTIGYDATVARLKSFDTAGAVKKIALIKAENNEA